MITITCKIKEKNLKTPNNDLFHHNKINLIQSICADLRLRAVQGSGGTASVGVHVMMHPVAARAVPGDAATVLR